MKNVIRIVSLAIGIVTTLFATTIIKLYAIADNTYEKMSLLTSSIMYILLIGGIYYLLFKIYKDDEV